MTRLATIVSVTALIVVVSLVSCTSDASEPARAGSETTNGVTVVAGTDGVSGKAAPGVTITVCTSGYDPVADTGFAGFAVAASDSTFAIAIPSPGVYVAWLSDTAQELAAMVPDLVVGGAPTEHVIELGPLHVIAGVVLRDSTPVAGANVFVVSSLFATTSSADGSYAMAGIPSGPVTVIADTRATGWELLTDTVSVIIANEPAQVWVPFNLEAGP
jgi:hypothetical protein